MSNIHTCRFCSDLCSCGEYTRHAPGEYGVRYGKRHYAHLQCLIKRHGAEKAIGMLFTSQIERIPFMLATALGVLPQLTAELERRKHLNPTGRIRLNVGY